MIVNGVVLIINLLTSWINVPVFNISDINTFFSPLGLAWNFVNPTILVTCVTFILSLEVVVWIYKLVRK